MHMPNSRIWVQLLCTVALALAVVWTGAIFWQDRLNHNTAIDQARSFSLSMHDAAMAGLTGMMVTGTVGQRAVFLDQIRQLNNVRDVRVLRGEAVVRLYGPGNASEANNPDEIERSVLATGKEIVRVESDAKGEYLRVVRPALSSKNSLGKDCTVCHQAAEGAVLGVVSMKISLDETNAALARQRMVSILVAIVTCIPVLAIIYPFIRKVVTRPLDQAIEVARSIAEGDLSRPIPVLSNNEIGHLQQALSDMRDMLRAHNARGPRGRAG